MSTSAASQLEHHPDPQPRCARSRGETLAAWRLVYQLYHDAGLIDSDAAGLHTVPQALGPDALTAGVWSAEQPLATVSAYADGEAGLPLDAIYPEQFGRMRACGWRLLEVGLLADSRRSSLADSIDLLNTTYHFGRYLGCTHLLCGVHPHHADFYKRIWGFVPAGPETVCSRVRHHPIVLLCFDLSDRPGKQSVGVIRAKDNPIADSRFEQRFQWSADECAAIEGILRRHAISEAS